MPIINIGSKLDGKGFKQAETALDKLNKSGKDLTRTLGIALGGAAILAYAKNAGKAFAEDEKAAASLSRTLDNLGLAFASNAGTINGFISRLERQTGVLDDELRPAMDRFLRATGDVKKSQDLLNLSLDIAAGTGKTATQVSQALQKAYLGQTQAIGRLGVGLSKAEIASSSFEEISARLSTLFAGQAATAAEGYAGSLGKLQVAANNAKEIIGGGLFDAISALGGGDVSNATGNIEKLATGIADTLRNVGELMARLKSLKPVLIAFGVAAAAAFFPVTTAIAGVIWLLGDLNKRLKEQSFKKGIIPNGMGNISMSTGSQDTQLADNKAAKLAKAAAAAEAKRRKAEAAAAAKSEASRKKAEQDRLKLAKASAIFDLKKIQIAAALKGQLSEEERARLLLMQAIEDENITLIEKYTKLLTEAQNKAKELQDTLNGIKATTFGNPFSEWVSAAGSTIEAIKAVSASMMAIPTIIQQSGREWSSFTAMVAQSKVQPNLKEWSSSFSPSASNPFTPPTGAPTAPPVNVTNNFNGVVTDPNAVADQINKILTDAANNTGNRYGIGTGNKDVLYIV
jgi:chemotaxis protein histidine kinase CheA